MRFAGIDFDTKRVAISAIDTGSMLPISDERLLEGDSAFERSRTVQLVVPGADWWRKIGVVQIAIEQPVGQKRDALYRVQGAILACIPPTIPVMELRPWEWRQALGLPGSGKRVEVKRAALDWAVKQPYAELISGFSQDEIDAYCIARAALALCERGAEIDR